MKSYHIINRSSELRLNEELDDSFYKNGSNIMVNGKILLPEWQTAITHVRNGLFIIYKFSIPNTGGSYRLINEKGKDLILYPCDSINIINKGAVYVKDKNGFNNVDHFDTDKMVFFVRRSVDRKCNFVKSDGTAIYPHWFDSYEYSNNVPPFVGTMRVKEGNKINYVDATTGKLISPVFFEDRDYPGRSWDIRQKYGEAYVAMVKHSGRWKALMRNGELL